MKFRNLMVLFILVFGINTLSLAEAQKKVKWEFSSEEWEGKRIASAEVIGFSYDEVWDKVLDVLLFKKFIPWGGLMKVRHEVVTAEKNSGLIVVRGIMKAFGSEDYKYVLKVMIRETDGQIAVKCRCDGKKPSVSVKSQKQVIEEFFQLLGGGL